MRIFLFLFICSGLLLSASLSQETVLGLLAPGLLPDGRLNPPDLERQRGERLDAKARQIARMLADQEQIARELIAGRLNLLEAACRVRDVNPYYHPGCQKPVMSSDGRDLSEGEVFCQDTIDLVRLLLSRDDISDLSLFRRLEADLGALRKDNGAIILPALCPNRPENNQFR
jgi:hypothetical protein